MSQSLSGKIEGGEKKEKNYKYVLDKSSMSYKLQMVELCSIYN